jgi:hypothetical protein
MKEAEDFSTKIMVAAKNLSSYVSLEKFQLYPEAYFESIFLKDLQDI